MLVLMRKRRDTAVAVQKILTEHGCIIKTRLGIHDGVADQCSDSGLIVLELVGEEQEKQALTQELAAIKDITVKRVDLSVP